MSNLRPGMHDNPAVFPTLPPREPDGEDIDYFAPEDGPFRSCWEYMLTHTLTDAEGAAFWTAANLVYNTMSAEATS